MFGYIRLDWFATSLALGLLFVYVWTPPPKVVVKFPSPNNAGHVTYRDKNDGCFKYAAKRVRCPTSGASVRPQPVTLEDFRAMDLPRKYDDTTNEKVWPSWTQ